MKQVMIVLILSMTASITMANQLKHHHGGHQLAKVELAEPDFDYLAYKLKLDENQLAELKNVMKKKREKHREALRKLHQEMEAIRSESREELAKILTEDQMETFDAMKSKGHRKEVEVIKIKD